MPVAARTDLIAFAKHWGNYGLRQFALSMVPADDVMHYVESIEAGEVEPSTLTMRYPFAKSGWFLLKMYLDRKAGHAVHASEPDSVMHAMLQPAKDLLRERYTVVGILEEFNTTLHLCSAALDMPGINWLHSSHEVANADTTFKKQAAEALANAWSNEELRSYIHLDLLLYDHAVEVFHEQVRLHGLL